MTWCAVPMEMFTVTVAPATQSLIYSLASFFHTHTHTHTPCCCLLLRLMACLCTAHQHTVSTCKIHAPFQHILYIISLGHRPVAVGDGQLLSSCLVPNKPYHCTNLLTRPYFETGYHFQLILSLQHCFMHALFVALLHPVGRRFKCIHFLHHVPSDVPYCIPPHMKSCFKILNL